MSKQIPIAFFRLFPLTYADVEQIYANILPLSYDDKHGYGFKEISFVQDRVHATLVKRVPIFIYEFNSEKNQLEKKEIFLFTESDFSIDAQFQLLEIFDITKNISKVRSTLRPLLNKNLQISPISFPLNKTLKKLVASVTNYRIEGLSISNFRYKEGVVGRFDIQNTDSRFAMELVNQYLNDVTKINISIAFQESSVFNLKIYNSGRLTLTCDENEFFYIYRTLKSYIFEE